MCIYIYIYNTHILINSNIQLYYTTSFQERQEESDRGAPPLTDAARLELWLQRAKQAPHRLTLYHL